MSQRPRPSVAKEVSGRTEPASSPMRRFATFLPGLSPEVRARYGLVPWQDIVGLRDIRVQEYFGIYLAGNH